MLDLRYILVTNCDDLTNKGLINVGKTMRYIFAVLMLFLAPLPAHGGGIDKLKEFIAAT